MTCYSPTPLQEDQEWYLHSLIEKAHKGEGSEEELMAILDADWQLARHRDKVRTAEHPGVVCPVMREGNRATRSPEFTGAPCPTGVRQHATTPCDAVQMLGRAGRLFA